MSAWFFSSTLNCDPVFFIIQSGPTQAIDRGEIMATGLESEAAFRLRASEIGLSEETVTLLKNGGVFSFGSFAFITNYQPGQSDGRHHGTDHNHGQGTNECRDHSTFFESTTLAVHEFKQRSERDERAEPAKMPVAERNARLEKKRLQGFISVQKRNRVTSQSTQ